MSKENQDNTWSVSRKGDNEHTSKVAMDGGMSDGLAKRGLELEELVKQQVHEARSRWRQIVETELTEPIELTCYDERKANILTFLFLSEGMLSVGL
ncbi:hypothetical protein SK128_020414 [Halocaridina rubra]|uniref:Uncharacterized protein n=1 Tax=Halocaridina rubra TaxID=373956 RepID=A0AAN8WU48_HALRR